MSISALFLFGSRARGDHSSDSDIDLLAISSVSEPTVTGMGPATLYLYSADWLTAKAEQGDLFVWHIISEALAIFDPHDVLVELQEIFQFAPSYEDEILKASDVGWAIVSLWNELRAISINRRIAWSVRTIAIARAAASQTPAFSAHALAEVLKHPNLISLVEQKDKTELSKKSLYNLMDFLQEFGFPRRDGEISSIDQYVSFFCKTENNVGLKLLEVPAPNSSYD
ncbi:nucleotidyltransferase domain-containing protein [Roseibium aggregatum]|uniref:Nucleotidyltransferase domain-containing protein n=1 Tax=Roseibium aggregatum TaxID=187304 RepID=A0A939EIE5_9HYPH|nr:nucleotidyltransferase domain-containing protein [Roseibium aggregatum]MBN9673715.1 nucleotidyltransferase domain-containing protein [Roseibium aggregatum]